MNTCVSLLQIVTWKSSSLLALVAYTWQVGGFRKMDFLYMPELQMAYITSAQNALARTQTCRST